MTGAPKPRRARCQHYGQPTARTSIHCANESRFGQRASKVCAAEEPSSPLLPYFVGRPEGPFDRFYCGCHGWD